MKSILDDVSEVTSETAEKVTKKIAARTAKKLKSVSPGSAAYKSGWRSKKLGDRHYVIYNAKLPGFTHLLENGHVISNQYGSYNGRARAFKHIAPVEHEETQEYINAIIEELNRNL